jgi:hypothetical protein
MMHFGSATALGVIGRDSGIPRVSFAFPEKPFSTEPFFWMQHLVASLACRLYGDEQHTFDPPYIPRLNEFYSRSMHFQYDKLRIEPSRIGLIVEATENDSALKALPVADLIERVLEIAGYETRPSAGGLIARQLIARMGGLQGTRAFKIPGVRRLIRTHGPTAVFTKAGALQLIASTDLTNTTARFSDHERLFIEPRRSDTKLTPNDVFAYLVEKGLFRIGVELACPHCRMRSWVALDSLRQRVDCELCGDGYDATRQLVDTAWSYRRSGVLGAERNALGAVPVILTLQQLQANLHEGLHVASLDLAPRSGVDLPACEVDFVWMIQRTHQHEIAIILGEYKDQGPIRLDEFRADVANLGRVADTLEREGFRAYVLLAKLAAFTSDEIAAAKALNDQYRRRVILLTARELEPYFMYERTKKEFSLDARAGTPNDLAETTAVLYFREASRHEPS